MRREWIEIHSNPLKDHCLKSPSMRREWIEIWAVERRVLWRKESPSMRREWIEIIYEHIKAVIEIVSLHAEGVD